jgi:hypothetical protein
MAEPGRIGHNLQRRQELMIRRHKAVEYRKMGLSFQHIGEILKISRQQASKDVAYMLKPLARSIHDNLDGVRILESERLDMAVWAIRNQVKEGQLPYIDRWLKLSESRRKLLGMETRPSHMAAVGARVVRVVRTPLPAPSEADLAHDRSRPARAKLDKPAP